MRIGELIIPKMKVSIVLNRGFGQLAFPSGYFCTTVGDLAYFPVNATAITLPNHAKVMVAFCTTVGYFCTTVGYFCTALIKRIKTTKLNYLTKLLHYINPKVLTNHNLNHLCPGKLEP
jgi:hypothetical protein